MHRGMRTVVDSKSRSSIVQEGPSEDRALWSVSPQEESPGVRPCSKHWKHVLRISRFTLRLRQEATHTGSESSVTRGCSDKVPVNPHGVFTTHLNFDPILQPLGKGAWDQSTSAQARRQCLKVNTFRTQLEPSHLSIGRLTGHRQDSA